MYVYISVLHSHIGCSLKDYTFLTIRLFTLHSHLFSHVCDMAFNKTVWNISCSQFITSLSSPLALFATERSPTVLLSVEEWSSKYDCL